LHLWPNLLGVFYPMPLRGRIASQILRPLSFKNSKLRGGWRQIMVIPHTFSPSRGGRVRWHTETNYGHSVFRRPGSIVSNKMQGQIMVILRLVSTKRSKFDYIRMMCRYWSFSNFCKFRWQGGSLAERCFAQTKLVSYLYFPFISNKRQEGQLSYPNFVRGPSVVGMRPSFDHFEVLGTHR